MERRTFLTGAGTAALLPMTTQAYSADEAPDVGAALAQFRKSIPGNLEQDYVEHLLIPFFLTSVFEGEPPLLPLIDARLSKENAFPAEFLSLGRLDHVQGRLREAHIGWVPCMGDSRRGSRHLTFRPRDDVGPAEYPRSRDQ